MAEHEFWLCDDNGRRVMLLKNVAYVSYSRTTQGYGTLLFGLPLNEIRGKINPIFRVDWRIDIWRSPTDGYSLRREGSFLLRKFHVYQREDGVLIVEYFGRSPIDLLRRESIDYAVQYTEAIDDIMKDVAAYLNTTHPASGWGPFYNPNTGASYPDFSIEAKKSEGPTNTYDASYKNILDVLQDLKKISFQMNYASPTTNKKIYFDVVETGISGRPAMDFGYKLVTYADMRGKDRTNGTVFSLENGNIKEPSWIEDHLDEINYITLICSDGGTIYGEAIDTQLSSRWNRIALVRNTTYASTDTGNTLSEQRRLERENAHAENISCIFLNSPGSNVQPRSLYGIDWDLGDLLTINFSGKTSQAEVVIVYVSIDDEGSENVLGRTEVGSA